MVYEVTIREETVTKVRVEAESEREALEIVEEGYYEGDYDNMKPCDLEHAEFDNAKVVALEEEISRYWITDLVATYESVYNVPEDKRITKYFGDYGSHFMRNDIPVQNIKEVYEKALIALGMSDEAFRIRCGNYGMSRSAMERLMTKEMESRAALRGVIKDMYGDLKGPEDKGNKKGELER